MVKDMFDHGVVYESLDSNILIVGLTTRDIYVPFGLNIVVVGLTCQ